MQCGMDAARARRGGVARSARAKINIFGAVPDHQHQVDLIGGQWKESRCNPQRAAAVTVTPWMLNTHSAAARARLSLFRTGRPRPCGHSVGVEEPHRVCEHDRLDTVPETELH